MYICKLGGIGVWGGGKFRERKRRVRVNIEDWMDYWFGNILIEFIENPQLHLENIKAYAQGLYF